MDQPSETIWCRFKASTWSCGASRQEPSPYQRPTAKIEGLLGFFFEQGL